MHACVCVYVRAPHPTYKWSDKLQRSVKPYEKIGVHLEWIRSVWSVKQDHAELNLPGSHIEGALKMRYDGDEDDNKEKEEREEHHHQHHHHQSRICGQEFKSPSCGLRWLYSMQTIGSKHERNLINECLDGSFDFTVLLVMAGMALSECGTGRVTDLEELSIK